MTECEHIVLDTNTNPTTLWCKVCDERYPFPRAKIHTAIMILKAFKQAHEDMGCTKEKYEKNEMMKKL